MVVRPYWGFGFNWPALVSMILFWALVAVAIVALIRFLRGRQHWPGPYGYGRPGPGPYPPPGAGTAGQILAERYARGEIGDEEFQRRMSVLRGGPGQPPPDGTPAPGGTPPPGSAPPSAP